MSLYPFSDFYQQLDGNDKGLRSANYLKTDNGVWVPQSGTSDGATKTQLTGSNVTNTPILENSTITDTSTRSEGLSVASYSNFDFLISNSLDQPVKIALVIGLYGLRLVKDDGSITPMAMTAANFEIPAGVRNIMLSNMKLTNVTGISNHSQWQKYNVDDLLIQYKCDVAPTSGSLTIELQGVDY